MCSFQVLLALIRTWLLKSLHRRRTMRPKPIFGVLLSSSVACLCAAFPGNARNHQTTASNSFVRSQLRKSFNPRFTHTDPHIPRPSSTISQVIQLTCHPIKKTTRIVVILAVVVPATTTIIIIIIIAPNPPPLPLLALTLPHPPNPLHNPTLHQTNRKIPKHLTRHPPLPNPPQSLHPPPPQRQQQVLNSNSPQSSRVPGVSSAYYLARRVPCLAVC